MSTKDEINKAIGAHGLWKNRLLLAIESGRSEFQPEHVCQDKHCDFGKWLYDPALPTTVKRMPEYETCRQLHASFHKKAGDILRLALSGKKTEALAAMERQSEYAAISGSLTQAMMKWKAAVAA